jgi:carboxypeptidase T
LKQQYKSYPQTQEFLEECIEKYPHLIKVQSIGKTWENRDIMLATLSLDLEYAHLKPALFYTGTIHAREWIGNELAVSFIDYILKNHDKNPKILEILSKNTLYIVPCANPDGFEYSRNHFSFWRKNRRDNGDGTFGVDLNRNFEIGFVKKSVTSSNVYGGPHPFSEPETAALKNFVDSHTNITVALDYHSQGNVFFPAHKFNHEMEIDGTDINTLCANMNHFISQVTHRKYGIHRGKPPTKLISGSGREYYYSKGIIASVVEVGTRNIPDFMQNMKESIDENIPALLYALSEAQNYSKQAPKRVENFHIEKYSFNEVILKWEYETSKDIYFEIYRNTENKKSCTSANLIATTKEFNFTDIQLKSGNKYYYYIRAVNNISKIKSPFAPKVMVQTNLQIDEFSKVIFPTPKNIGYVAQKSPETNPKHFGVNSLFIGVNETKGVSYGVMQFALDNIPKNATITYANISLYPLNRVNAKIEKYGEWSISFVDEKNISDITSYEQIANADILETIGKTIPSERLTQGIWSNWELNEKERELLQSKIEDKKVLFKISGPEKLPLGRDSQMMMFDLGYGRFGGGIHYRPNIQIKYQIPAQTISINSNEVSTISKHGIDNEKLCCGFDQDNDKIYGYMKFDLSSLPNPDCTVITDAYIQIKNKNTTKSKQDIRYNMEFVDIDTIDYDNIKSRERIEFIGYEVSRADFQKRSTHNFIFDQYSKNSLEEVHKNKKFAHFVIKPTSAISKNHLVQWYSDNENGIKLMINYINRRKYPVKCVEDAKVFWDNGKIKITWKNPKDDDLVGIYVVRNRFHIPKNPYDGDKIYAGRDEYTYDDFGSKNIDKYYAIFTYDNVPNYSEPIIIQYKVD